GLHITLLNLPGAQVPSDRVTSVEGDARDLSRWPDKSFDVVFSNSVIEHVGELADQEQMAQEIRRVSQRYFVQTPNRYFPIEPHFHVPGFQLMPLSVRASLLQRFNLGWVARRPDALAARTMVESVRLLDERTLRKLFPEAHIYSERLLGWTKSFVAYA